MTLRALTIRQPWAWAILHAGKRIENRTWRPPDWLIGQRIAVHAGGVLEEGGLEWLGQRGFCPPADIPHAAVVGLARIEAVIEQPVFDPWWEGPIGWLLSDVVVLPHPIPCPGARGLREVPEEIQQEIEHQLQDRL